MSGDAPAGLSVLIIDDEKDFAETLASRLHIRNITARAAFSGEQGLALLEETPPDVTLLDMWMPGLSGLAVLREIRRRFAALPVIIVSGHCSEPERAAAETLGIQGFHDKPVDFAELLENITRAAGR
jgi:DNA-binding response OmpR family regulator